ncbi:serine/threonine-protein kinase Nek1 isoform X2 [Paramormyrops kingsleyae]|uniref:non-specific serine/threonine protein kinase n=1 Tax=Paramormyrops kingsleyae TaxID=1676925 RepID=A0A3B3RHR5_9TELE|nr:serine/threonine-protein kinase Nek1 isoform X2 [Paramormyrops kingsleyae]
MDKYERVTKIGEGSFGKAILVKSKDDGKQYVIKEIGISRMSNKERHESRKEVAVLANMSHPNIVKYRESFEEGGCLYIVMDYCEGGDLFKRINAQKGALFPETQILDWFVQICLALKHVHDRKILHRDIKSQNIFLAKDGTVQLGDFGIARVLNSTVELARTCIGTPYYLSPEICENKPYNNKSDIWALGCVLYEMCTLKHAFEAGNMKNLVLKIIRGSYPPVSVSYSHELRGLVAQLFRRSPRERPSVTAILEKPFLSQRIHKFLPPQLLAQEFSHTCLKQPKAAVAPVPAKRPPPSPSIVAPAHKITKPAAKYGVPLTGRKPSDAGRKCIDRKPAVKHKPAPLPSPQRKASRVEEERRKLEEGVRKRQMDLMEKDRKQREQMLMLKSGQLKRYEREKLNRINQARERGWCHALGSSGASPERKFSGGGGRIAGPRGNRAHLDQNYAALDLVSKPLASEVAKESGDSALRGVAAVAGPVLANGPVRLLHHNIVNGELGRLDLATRHASASRQRGQVTSERTKQVQEFWQRKKEAMLNKARAEGQLGTLQRQTAGCGGRPGSGAGGKARGNKEEEEYLARLRQIRLQNFNERQQLKARLRGEKYDSDGSDSQESSEEAEQRRKKMETLKAQAKARAAVLMEQLEKRRREAYEREKKAWEDHLAARGVKVDVEPGPGAGPQGGPPQQDPSVRVVPQFRPAAPVISMTAALKDVGVEPVTQQREDMEPSKPDGLDLQNEKREILRRLNQNLKTNCFASKEEEEEDKPVPPQEGLDLSTVHSNPAEEKGVPSAGDRRKWEAGSPPIISVAQQTLEETGIGSAGSEAASPSDGVTSAGDRRKWEPGDPPLIPVAQLTLEETYIGSDEITAGEVIQPVGLDEVPRRAWGRSPDTQVLKVLQEAELQPLTLMDSSVQSNMSSTESQKADSLADVTEAALANSALASPGSPGQSSEPGGQGEQETKPDEEGAEEPTLVTPVMAGEEAQDVDEDEDEDVEVLEVEECPKQALGPPAEVVQAWEQKAPPQPPQPSSAEGSVPPLDSSLEKQCSHTDSAGAEGTPEEPLFLKLSSPARRPITALAALSNQSSQDDSIPSWSRSVSPSGPRGKDALLIGLSTGLFDANNPKMLRTCSLPDLSKLFRTFEDCQGLNGVVAAEDNLDIEDIRPMKVEEHAEIEDIVYEDGDEDLQQLRASMERLLREPSEDYSEEEEAGFPGSPPEEQVGESQGLLSNGIGPDEDPPSSENELNEEWHSDNSDEEQESDTDHQDSIFSRLEELRFKLEQEMGFECFVEAYNKIKAIHEDEDENIDLGSSMLQSVLGSEHQHLYPKILHLVMADGAYQEDNDE